MHLCTFTFSLWMLNVCHAEMRKMGVIEFMADLLQRSLCCVLELFFSMTWRSYLSDKIDKKCCITSLLMRMPCRCICCWRRRIYLVSISDLPSFMWACSLSWITDLFVAQSGLNPMFLSPYLLRTKPRRDIEEEEEEDGLGWGYQQKAGSE